MCVCSFGGYHCQLHCAAKKLNNVDYVFICFTITKPLRSFQLVLHSTHSFKPSFCKLDVWSIAQWPHKWPQRQERKRVRWSMRQQNPRRRALLQSAAMGVLLPKKSRTIRVCGSLRCDPSTQKKTCVFLTPKKNPFFRKDVATKQLSEVKISHSKLRIVSRCPTSRTTYRKAKEAQIIPSLSIAWPVWTNIELMIYGL